MLPFSTASARILSMVGVGVTTALVVVACSTDRGNFNDAPPGFDPPDAAPDAPPACGYRCSPDLKKVIKGCVGQEAEETITCNPDQGCAVDKCIDACAAAEVSKGSAGCSFWTIPADDVQYGAGSCFAAMIANTWDRPITISAEYGAEALDISKSVYTVTGSGENVTYTVLAGGLPPGQVAIVFLSQAETLTDPDAPYCPKGTKAALAIDPIRHGTTKNKAFHLKTDAPVSAYSIFPYGGAQSYYPTATMLYPVSSWDTAYVAVSPAKFMPKEVSSLDRRTLQIVANENDTQVSMKPTVDIGQGLDVAPGINGEVVTWTLSKGQAIQITQDRSTSGSPITSNKPVGVFGGSPCTFIPSEIAYCDLTQQQIAPFSQWGREYALVPYRPRTNGIDAITRETVAWSFVGAADGTVLTYDPEKPAGAPAKLEAGEVATFMTDAIVTVRSQDSKHPFHASVYMTGATYGGGSPGGGKTLGDPDFAVMPPSEQFLDRYVFFADFTYPETALTVVRKKAAGAKGGFAPVELECGGELTGWTPLGASGEYEYAWVVLTTGYQKQKFAKGECGTGRHVARSDGLFSVMVWGWGKDASYGYTAGVGSRPVNDAPPPKVQ